MVRGECVIKKKSIFLLLNQNICCAGFYSKLNVWGSLGLNFDYDGGPIIENGGPIFLYVYIIGFVLLFIKNRSTRLKGND